MDRNDILAEVNAVFRDVFDDDSISVTDATTAADIEEWDSLTHITLINEIENLFNLKFSMKDVLAMENVGGLLDNIERLLADRNMA